MQVNIKNDMLKPDNRFQHIFMLIAANLTVRFQKQLVVAKIHEELAREFWAEQENISISAGDITNLGLRCYNHNVMIYDTVVF